MNYPETWCADLTEDAWNYAAVARDGDLKGRAALKRSSTARDGRYELYTEMSRGSTKGRMGARQHARCLELVELAKAALLDAAAAAGWHVEPRLCVVQGTKEYWFRPEPAPARPVVLSAIIDSTARFLEETAPADDDQVVADLVTLEAGALAVPQVAPARPKLPLTHSLRLIPRPFSQLARRHYRMFGATWRGYNAFLSAWPYYHHRRREPVIWCAALTRAHVRRCERARARRAALTVTRLPPMLYGQGKVA